MRTRLGRDCESFALGGFHRFGRHRRRKVKDVDADSRLPAQPDHARDRLGFGFGGTRFEVRGVRAGASASEAREPAGIFGMNEEHHRQSRERIHRCREIALRHRRELRNAGVHQKHLKPQTPALCSLSISIVLPGTSPPQNPTCTRQRPATASAPWPEKA